MMPPPLLPVASPHQLTARGASQVIISYAWAAAATATAGKVNSDCTRVSDDGDACCMLTVHRWSYKHVIWPVFINHQRSIIPLRPPVAAAAAISSLNNTSVISVINPSRRWLPGGGTAAGGTRTIGGDSWRNWAGEDAEVRHVEIDRTRFDSDRGETKSVMALVHAMYDDLNWRHRPPSSLTALGASHHASWNVCDRRSLTNHRLCLSPLVSADLHSTTTSTNVLRECLF